VLEVRKRQRTAVPRRGSRAPAAAFAVVLALAAAGCASDASSQSAGTPVVATAEQVLTTCVHNYFYNGILPEPAAKANCTSCVVGQLRKLGIRPGAGETEADVLTGVRLGSSDAQSLQDHCTESDAASQ
jgi:hypothetical protein